MQASIFALVVIAVGLLSENAFAGFTCPPPGIPGLKCPSLPTPGDAPDVLHLQPGNIAGVMALGDSITAGFAMKDGPLEYRGSVYSTGGDDGALTIGNFLTFYNPNLKGKCQGETIPLVRDGKGLNFAVSGAVVGDVPGQIDRMVAKMKTSEYSDIIHKWKLLTLFIGANDICGCRHTTPQGFSNQLDAALTKIHQEIPNVFVNIMTIFNISQVWDDSKDSKYCEVAVPILHECECLNKNATERQMMDDLGLKVNQVTRDLAAKYAALGDRNFTVVVQPGVDQLAFGKYNKTIALDFLSGLDCFHPSLCADQGFAVSIWNNMWVPPEKKQRTLDPLHPPTPYCPTASDYIQ